MAPQPDDSNNGHRDGIGTLNEFSLHADLIAALAKPGDQLEAEIEGYYADILRGDQIIEVQTRNLGSLRKKIAAFSPHYQVTIVHPVAQTKWIVRKNVEGAVVSRRKSPKHGRVEEIFTELVRAWGLLDPPTVSLQVPIIDAEEVWLDDGQGSWRRKHWSISERHLLEVHFSETFTTGKDFLKLLPQSLPEPFTNKQLSAELGIRAGLAGKITYTLRKMHILEFVGKTGNQHLFTIKKEIVNHG
jgi:hypothetical protein